MGQNKTVKATETTKRYLKYSIGEIFLVVIGILIALQINNWNERQKASSKEQRLFDNLEIDFESRLDELKEFNKAREQGIEAYLKLNLIVADAVHKPGNEILDSLLSHMVNGYKFNEEFKMMDVLFNTGLINDINDEQLKRKLIEWPQIVEEMLEEQRMHNRIIDTKFIPLLSKYVSIRAIYEQFDFRQYNLPHGEPVTLTKNYEGLLSNPIFENYLAEVELLTRVTMIDTKTLILSAEEIIQLLRN